MNIIPTPEAFYASHKQHSLVGLTTEQIDAALGFRGDHESDPFKVASEWRFTADGHECAVWDYKGSHHLGQFSAWGPREVFEELFPGKVQS